MALMNPLLGSNLVTASAPFDPTLIGNSVWLDGSADYLSKTPSAGTTTRWIVSFWVQRNTVNTGLAQTIFSAGTATGNLTWIRFDSSDNLDFAIYQGSVTARKTSSAKYRDVGWYHICVSFDSGSGITASDRIRLFVNGIEVTALSASTATPSGETTAFNANLLHEIGRYSFNGGEDSNVYLTQFTMLENKSFQNGDLSITDLLDTFTFGTNGSQFAPKADADIAALASTAGGNSFCLDFADSADLGNDISSNANDFTPTSMSSANQSSSTPSKVYPILNSLDKNSAATLSSGNLRYSSSSGTYHGVRSTFWIDDNTPKIYWEATYVSGGGSSTDPIGLADYEYLLGQLPVVNGTAVFYTNTKGSTASFSNETARPYNTASYDADTGDVLRFAYDPATKKLWVGNATNGTYLGGGDPATDSTPTATLTIEHPCSPAVGRFGSLGTTTYDFNFGQTAFTGTVPTGFVSLNSADLTAPDYQGIDYFKPVLYTGNGTAIGSGGKSVTGVGWQPDEVWIKNRDAADDHALYDIVRGVTKQLESNTYTAESTETEGLTTFGSDGFTVGNLDQVNTNTEDYVSWNWLGSNSTATTSPAGTIASTTSVASAGHFSVGTYTGQTAAGTVGHGLGGVAEMVIVWDKGTDNSTVVYHAGTSSSAETNYLVLQQTDAASSSSSVLFWNDTAPTSSVFSVGTGSSTNGDARPKSFLAFRSVAGVCKVGSYIGNGSADGPYISTGFKPSFIMIKRAAGGTGDWNILDTSREPFNAASPLVIRANLTTADEAGSIGDFDILSDGFKLKAVSANANTASSTYIYLAMADIGGNGTLPPVYGR